MIIFGTIIIAFACAGILLWKFHERIVWWEIALVIIIPILLSLGAKALIETYSVYYTEYWGDEVVSVIEEEPYNYWHSEICSREVACGTDENGNIEYCTEYYDCSHQDDVGPNWYAKTRLGNSIVISEEQYDKWNKQFGGNRIKTNTHENYDPNDKCVNSSGTKFSGKNVGKYSYTWETRWDGNYLTSVPLTTEHSYINKIKASDYTVFNYIKISEDEADSLNLYDYPDMINNFSYPSVLGYNSNKINNEFHRINGHLGYKKQVRIWVLVHNTTDSEIGYKQECYWVGGNKNELVINIGVQGKDIKWCHVFSWTNISSLKNDIKQFVLNQKVLNDNTFMQIADYIHNETEKRFERLEFSQFDYLSIEPPTWTIIVSYIITIIVCIIIGALIINNKY
ncbi:MAG: hypothetical protein HPY57_15410 [Ignavibacteria bacterium]|nr:hypothetical protein [Ignavibacteria bacterium]